MRVVVDTTWLLGAAVVVSCSPNGGGSSSGSGGSIATAGTAGSGGGSTFGGAHQKGGAASSSGGAATTGGSVAAGTANAGSTTHGGAPANGGAAAGGTGTPASGGSSTGGIPAGGSAGAGAATTNGGSPAAGTAGASGASSGPCSAAGLVFCDTFDTRAAGQKPSGAPWLASQCFDSNHTLKVDTAQSHSGTQSLLSQGIPYGACMLHASLGDVTDFWVRSWVRFGQGDANQFGAHEVVVFDLTPTTDTDDPGIRVGFRGDSSCIPTGAEVNITGGEEKTGCTGYQFQAEKWYCLELHVAVAATGVKTDFWIDGADQAYTIHGMPAQTVDNPNYLSAKFLRLGTRSYSSVYAAPIWVDDIAVGTSRIGCN